MQTSNSRIILTDVDGVLLEWEKHFTDWMLQRSYYNDHDERNMILERSITKTKYDL